jgi:hypothetical protein
MTTGNGQAGTDATTVRDVTYLTSAKLVRKSAAGVDGFDGLTEFAG